ncbi:MAG: hypothetical protein PHQ04_04060 [Opitutaceae bacterium]|nr:hypothetical protein [Opitutaceae bacterium]
MKKRPADRIGQPEEQRVGFSFYTDDLKAVRALVAALRERQVRVKRTFLVRALAHVVPEDEMFAYALTRNRAEQAGKVPVETEINQCLAFNLLADDVDKMERVSDQLADKQLRNGRSFVLRALLHAPWDHEALARAVRKFEEKFPDPRSRAGRALKRA